MHCNVLTLHFITLPQYRYFTTLFTAFGSYFSSRTVAAARCPVTGANHCCFLDLYFSHLQSTINLWARTRSGFTPTKKSKSKVDWSSNRVSRSFTSFSCRWISEAVAGTPVPSVLKLSLDITVNAYYRQSYKRYNSLYFATRLSNFFKLTQTPGGGGGGTRSVSHVTRGLISHPRW